MSDLISRQAAIDALDEQIKQCDKALSSFDISLKDAYAAKVEKASLVAFRETLEYLPTAEPESKSCKTCHLWEDGEQNIACPWGSNYEHYEDDYCSLWEKQN